MFRKRNVVSLEVIAEDGIDIVLHFFQSGGSLLASE